MIPVADNPITQLPIVPTAVLVKHRVYEQFDNRFRSCARLLQSLWRQRQNLPIGTYTRTSGSKRTIGSLISTAAGTEGRNFLTPAIAEIARLEAAYQERDALIDQNRLFTNLLSSMPLAFNACVPLHLDRDLAARVLRAIIPGIDLKAVVDVLFEHSPGRQDPTLTGDRSAFDVAFVYERSDGKRGLLGLEVKYSETGTEPAPPELNPRYTDLARSSGLFKEPDHAALRVNPLQQLFREHLLAQAVVMRGAYAEAYFVLVAPRLNHLVQNSASLYASFLAKPTNGQVPFVNVELEQLVGAFGWSGAHDHSLALTERYLDWGRIDEVVRAAVKAKGKTWQTEQAPPARPAVVRSPKPKAA
ncbi:hypothetical protein [Novosphingobium sp. Gsoil 351]|uniref:PGN_0703 family putative restriction endonuclease n=1 Tax=Novosphingobium sp. Gsoil 351 TaxID=2675225 RepID=UPI0012B48D54|nr:hypothetical protein [Novosphingobium sp. Gsoil 351]QGN55919.1 hypothetical protein GKE62_16515 [Novosphingobium sp. Gsoil 351]